MFRSFSDFPGFLHYFVMAKLATSRIRVKYAHYLSLMVHAYSMQCPPVDTFLLNIMLALRTRSEMTAALTTTCTESRQGGKSIRPHLHVRILGESPANLLSFRSAMR